MEFKQTPSKQRYTAKRLVKDSTVLAMRGLGYMLSLFFLCLLAMLTYSFVHDICGFYSSIKHNNVLSTVKELFTNKNSQFQQGPSHHRNPRQFEYTVQFSHGIFYKTWRHTTLESKNVLLEFI